MGNIDQIGRAGKVLVRQIRRSRRRERLLLAFPRGAFLAYNRQSGATLERRVFYHRNSSKSFWRITRWRSKVTLPKCSHRNRRSSTSSNRQSQTVSWSNARLQTLPGSGFNDASRATVDAMAGDLQYRLTKTHA